MAKIKENKNKKLEEITGEFDDPGIFFILAMEAKLHACMGLPAVANVTLSLQQGWNMRIF